MKDKRDTLTTPPKAGEWHLCARQTGRGLLESGSDFYYALPVPEVPSLPRVDLELCFRLAGISSISGPGGWDTESTPADRRKAISQFVEKYGALGIGYRQVGADDGATFYGESEVRWWSEALAVWQVLCRAQFLKLIAAPRRVFKKNLAWFTFVAPIRQPGGAADLSRRLGAPGAPTKAERQAGREVLIKDLREQITERLRELTKIEIVGDALPLALSLEATTPLACIWRFLAEFVTGGVPVHCLLCAGGCGRLLVTAPRRGVGQRADAKYCDSAACRKRVQRARLAREGLTARGTERKRAPNKSKKGSNRGKA